MVDFSFLCFQFHLCSSVSAVHHSPIRILASLELFSNSQHQSTPERHHVGHEDSGRVDLDHIRHSFGPPTTPPFEMAAFRIPQKITTVDITGGAGSGEGAGLSTTAVEGNEAVVTPRSVALTLLLRRDLTSPLSRCSLPSSTARSRLSQWFRLKLVPGDLLNLSKFVLYHLQDM